MIKRLISITLLLMMFLGIIAKASTPTDVENTQYQRAVELITALKLIESPEDDMFKPDEEINRGEFVKIIIKMLGLDAQQLEQSEKAKFTDLGKEHPDYHYVNTACSLGLISGYNSDAFGVDDAIKTEQAIKIVVTALGYDMLAMHKGGYPSGYMMIASEKGILSRLRLKSDEPLKRGEAALMIYNALDTELLRQTSFGEMSEFNSNREHTALSEYLDITKGKGQITGNGNTRLFDSKSVTNDDEVEIDTKVYKTGETNAAEMLGYFVDFYYKQENDENILVAVLPIESKSIELKIPADDIVSYKLGDLEYYENGENSNYVKKVKISSTAD